MGTFLDSIHLRHDDAAAVAAAIKALPYEDHALVRVVKRRDWVSVFCELLVGPSILAAPLSSALDSALLLVQVADSDRAWMSTYVAGKRCGGIESPSRAKKQARARAANGLGVFVPEASLPALLDIWDDDPISREDVVFRSAALLGIDSALLLGTFYDFEDDATAITFEIGALPELGEAPTGAPRLWCNSWSSQGTPLVGAPFSYLFGTQSEGGSGRGVRVSALGSAVVENAVRIDAFRSTDGTSGTPLTRREDGGFTSDFPDVEIRSAPGFGPGPSFFVDGTRLLPGVRTLAVEITPLEGESKGSRIEIATRPPARRPRKWSGDWEHLSGLSGERIITASVMFAGDADAARPLAIDAMLTFERALGATHTGEYVRFSHDGAHFRKGVVRSGKLTRKLLEKQLADNWVVRILHEQPASRRTDPSCNGFAFAQRSWSSAHGRVPVPILALWATSEGRTEAEVRQLDDALTEIVDVLARVAPLDQAFITRAHRANDPSGDTAYEHACGLGNGGHDVRPWSSRWLRGIGDRMWIGRDLFARIRRVDLERSSVVEERPHGTVFVRTEPSRFDALEEALDGILPDGSLAIVGADTT